MVQKDQQQRQRREALLAINNEFLTILVAYYDRAEKVVPIVRHCPSLVTCLVAVEKLGRQILQKFGNLLALPLIFSLVIVDRIFAVGEQLSDGAAIAVDLAGGAVHWCPLFRLRDHHSEGWPF